MPHPCKLFIKVTITIPRNDAFQKFGRRNAGSTACRDEFAYNMLAVGSRSQRTQARIRTLAFYIPIYIVVACVCIWEFIVSDVIDFKLLHESFVDNPWSFWDDFVHPSTVPYCLESITVVNVTFIPAVEARAKPFRMCHDTLSFVQSNLFIRIDADKKINGGK
jgi:hypothetical protein